MANSGNQSKGPVQKTTDRLSQIANTLSPQQGTPYVFPAFDDLPKIPGQPQGCMWGFYDRDGKKDEIGSVNLLTPEVVQQASREIVTGQHIQLDWPLINVEFPGFSRKKFSQTLIDLKKIGFTGLDDEVYINTQSGSQWDSLKHVAMQKTGMYYNGLTHEQALTSTTNGTHNWCQRGGIVGRGVFVDWLRWYEHTHGTPPSPVTRHEITVSDVEATLQYQGTTTRPGDIMIIRSGYVRWHDLAGPEVRKAGTQDQSIAIGLKGDEATVRWLYSRHFAAVAGDTVAFEAWPPKLEEGWCLHEWLLAQWGTPIGEMWDLERLSTHCERENRWTFFLTSAPLHVPGGVGSPPGAIAIF